MRLLNAIGIPLKGLCTVCMMLHFIMIKGIDGGHLKEFPTPYDPDNDLAAWNKSQKRTIYFVNMWNNKCGCK
jgi:hypothetical protein